LVQFSGGQHLNGYHGFFLGGIEPVSVASPKGIGRHQSGPLVSVMKPVILGDSMRLGNGQVEK